MQNKKGTLNLQTNLIQNAINMKNKFPTIIFTSTATSKALMSLSRKDGYEKNNDHRSIQVSKELKPRRSNIQPLKSLKYINSTQDSPTKCRQSYKSLSKISKTLYFVEKLETNRNNLFASLSKLQQQLQSQKQYESQRLQAPPIVQKQLSRRQDNSILNQINKFNDKKIGFVYGYAANQHMGILNTHQNNRICIKNNMVRLGNKLKQISFYAIFEGRNGYAKAEFMKQNFYNALVKDELFLSNFEKAISRAFQTVDKQFNGNPRFQGDYSVSSCVMCFIIAQKMYIIRYGSPNATISMNLGSYIKSMYVQYKQGELAKKKSFSSFTTYSKIPQTKEEIHIRMFELNDNYDFLVLGSEGLYQISNFYNELGATVWKYILDQEVHNNNGNQNSGLTVKLVNNTSRLPKVCAKICEQSAKIDTLGRCMSMILIQFPGMQACFEQQEQLQLPNSKAVKQNNLSLQKEERQSLQRDLTFKMMSTEQEATENKYEITAKYLKSLNIE